MRGDGRQDAQCLLEARSPTKLQFEESGPPAENGPVEQLDAQLVQHLARYVLAPEDAPLCDAPKHQVEERPLRAANGIADAFDGALDHGGGEQRSGLKPSKNVDYSRKRPDAISLGDEDVEAARGKKRIPGLTVDGSRKALRGISAELGHMSEDVAVHED